MLPFALSASHTGEKISVARFAAAQIPIPAALVAVVPRDDTRMIHVAPDHFANGLRAASPFPSGVAGGAKRGLMLQVTQAICAIFAQYTFGQSFKR